MPQPDRHLPSPTQALAEPPARTFVAAAPELFSLPELFSPDAPVRVLLITADEEAALALLELLGRIGHLRLAVDRVPTIELGLERLRALPCDICLVAGRLADSDGLRFISAAQDRGYTTPIILLPDDGSLELDLRAMALGAADFLDRGRRDDVALERTIRYTLARRRQTERLSRLAQYDQLTGLANRALLQDRLERALAWGRRHDRLVAVMVLDLNGFKTVNDDLGHAAGDRLLCLMAKRFRQRLRETDTVARLGGDEFALVIENLAKPEHAALVAHKLLDAVAPPADINGREVLVTASLGVALFPKDGSEVTTLLRHADAAMYRAKAEGGNLFRCASPEIERHVRRGALLESDFRRGLGAREFVLRYQPQIALGDGHLAIAGLMRWDHPELGLIGSERFLPLAEDTGLIVPLTERLIDAGLEQLARWRTFGLDRLHLALPLLSKRPLGWTDFVDLLDARLREASVPPGALELEVEESLLLSDLERGGAGIRRLRQLGVRLALDAFGAGPTSLRGLRPGVIDTLKLDHALLQGVPEQSDQTTMVAAILELGRSLGLRLVAAGGETQQQVSFLRRHGCSAVQAFMSCPPLPADLCTRWLHHAAARQDRPERALAAEPTSVLARGVEA